MTLTRLHDLLATRDGAAPPGELVFTHHPFAGSSERTYTVDTQSGTLHVKSPLISWSIERRELAQLIRFCIWDWWVKGEWFGARRALHQWCEHTLASRSITAKQLNRIGGDR